MEIIRFIVYVITEYIIASIMIYSYGRMTDNYNKLNQKQKLYIMVMSILMIINNLYNIVSLRLTGSIIISILMNKGIYKHNFKKTIIFTFVYYIFATILELLTSSILIFANIENINEFNNSIIFKTAFSLFNGLIIFLMFKFERILNIIKKLLISINKNIFYIISFFILFLNIIMIIKCIKSNDLYFTILMSLCLIFIVIAILIISQNKYQNFILKERNKNLKINVKAYQKTVEDCREFKHNLKNELYSIKSILPEKAQNDINRIITKYNTAYDWISKIEEIPYGLQGILFLKKNEAETYKINMIINTNNPIEYKNVDYIDLSNTLGILLDNAIEAVKKLKTKILEVNITEYENFMKIRIINKFKNKININKLGKKNYSTKEIKSGIGLNYLRKINNPNIKINFKVINDLFISEIKYQTNKKST